MTCRFVVIILYFPYIMKMYTEEEELSDLYRERRSDAGKQPILSRPRLLDL